MRPYFFLQRPPRLLFSPHHRSSSFTAFRRPTTPVFTTPPAKRYRHPGESHRPLRNINTKPQKNQKTRSKTLSDIVRVPLHPHFFPCTPLSLFASVFSVVEGSPDRSFHSQTLASILSSPSQSIRFTVVRRSSRSTGTSLSIYSSDRGSSCASLSLFPHICLPIHADPASSSSYTLQWRRLHMNSFSVGIALWSGVVVMMAVFAHPSLLPSVGLLVVHVGSGAAPLKLAVTFK